jgi:hypothetical protein
MSRGRLEFQENIFTHLGDLFQKFTIIGSKLF